ncbi:MAG: nucleotide sugar dehydrogenase [Rhodothermales bacterium]
MTQTSSTTTDASEQAQSAAQAQLTERIRQSTALIGVIGLGYVGLPLSVEHARRGFKTIGIDLNTERVLRLASGTSYVDDVDSSKLAEVVKSGMFVPEDSFDSAALLDVVFICVPTPVTPNKDPDTSYIETAARKLAETIRPGQLIVLKSTTYPNTTEGLVLPILEEAAQKKGMQIGRDYFLAFSPERIDPGNARFTTANTPVVVGGVTRACTTVAKEMLSQVVSSVLEVSNPRVAEMEKLLENIFRSVNIALVNELAQLCDRVGGVSVWEVVEAASTKPFGFMPFEPGPGLGGHCIPIDPYYLSWFARGHDFETGFITLSARVNEQMPFYVVEAIGRALASEPIRLEDARVLILGVAFKKNVNDTRHSPSIKVLELLSARGIASIEYSDPFVPQIEVQTVSGAKILKSKPIDEAMLRSYDLVVIGTDHSSFQYSMIAEHAALIVDTRNALGHIPHRRDKVRLLGGGAF